MRGMGMAALALVMGACKTEEVDSGTAVGNPGKLTVALDSSNALGARTARLPVDMLVAFDCGMDESEDDVVATGIELDVLAGGSLLLPPGQYCGLGLLSAEPLQIEGALDDGRDYSVALPLEDIIVWNDGGFSVEADRELALWLGADGTFEEAWLGEEPGDPIVVSAEDETALLLADLVLDTTVLVDEDGETLLAAGAPELWDLQALDEDEDDGAEASACGGGAAAGVLLPGLLLMGVRRRRG